MGTRNGHIMILSSSEVSYGRKTIATFKDTDELLTNEGAFYVGKVDLRFKGTSRKGENIASTKLGALKEVVAHIDFSYARPVSHGEKIEGDLLLVKRNKEEISLPMICKRYLKN